MIAAGVDGVDFREENHSTHTDYPEDYGFNDVVLQQCGKLTGQALSIKSPPCEAMLTRRSCASAGHDYRGQVSSCLQPPSRLASPRSSPRASAGLSRERRLAMATMDSRWPDGRSNSAILSPQAQFRPRRRDNTSSNRSVPRKETPSDFQLLPVF